MPATQKPSCNILDAGGPFIGAMALANETAREEVQQ